MSYVGVRCNSDASCETGYAMTLFRGEKPIFPDARLLFERSRVVQVPEDETGEFECIVERAHHSRIT